jgi:phosphoglycerate dehydrogenase-like enzyme
MLIIAVARQFSVARERLMTGVHEAPVGTELNGLRLGLIGFGHSARALALMARGLGLRVSAVSRSSIDDATAREYGLERNFEPDRLDELIAASDVLSLHLPLNDQTEHLIDARRLALLSPAGMLINVSRGALVDEEALLAALRAGRLTGAGIDAWSSEPPDPDSPLLRHPRVVATPHLAGVTMQTAQRRAAIIAANVDRVASGLDPLHLVEG